MISKKFWEFLQKFFKKIFYFANLLGGGLIAPAITDSPLFRFFGAHGAWSCNVLFLGGVTSSEIEVLSLIGKVILAAKKLFSKNFSEFKKISKNF